MSIAFTLAYTESLFLLLAVAAFLAAETRRPWLAGLFITLATLTRPTGILLLLPLVVLYMQRDGWRPTRAWVPLVLAPLAMLGWYGYLWWLTGDPMASFHAQAYWVCRRIREPLLQRRPTPAACPLMPVILGYYVLLGLYAFSLVYLRPNASPSAYRVVVIVAIGSLFLAGRLDSAVRYLAIAWPAYWGIATRDSRVGRMAILALFALLQVILLWYIFTWNVLP